MASEMNANRQSTRLFSPDEHPLPVTALAELFGFTPETLEANRAGHLTDGQRQDLLYHSLGYLVRGLVMLVLSLTLIASVTPLADTRLNQVLLAIACAVSVALGAGWLVAAYRIVHPRIQSVSGPAQRAGDPAHPTLTVGTVTLRVPYRRWKRLPATLPGEYCAYYGPTRSLLSIEPIPSEIAP